MSTVGDRLAQAHDLGVVRGEIGLGAAAAGALASSAASRRCSCFGQRLSGVGGVLALGREHQEPVGRISTSGARTITIFLSRSVRLMTRLPARRARSCRAGASDAGWRGAKVDRQVEGVEVAAAVRARLGAGLVSALDSFSSTSVRGAPRAGAPSSGRRRTGGVQPSVAAGRWRRPPAADGGGAVGHRRRSRTHRRTEASCPRAGSGTALASGAPSRSASSARSRTDASAGLLDLGEVAEGASAPTRPRAGRPRASASAALVLAVVDLVGLRA